MLSSIRGDSVYNAEIKQRFFDANPTVHKKEWVFASAQDYEQKCKKDLAEFNYSEAMDFLNSLGMEEAATAANTLTTIRRYIVWCEKNGALSVSHSGFLSVKADDIDFTESLKRVLFKDEEDLVDSIQSVRSLDEGYADVPVLILGWVGLTREEIAALRDKDVDLSNRIVYGSDGSILAAGLSDLVVDVLRRYRDCLVSERENNKCFYEVVKDLSVDSFIKRMVPKKSKKNGTEYSKLQITSQIDKLAKKYEDKGYPRRHTFTNVWRSGRFHKLWEIEQSGVDVTSRENRPVVESVMRNKKNYYNSIKMYGCYKKAFYTE